MIEGIKFPSMNYDLRPFYPEVMTFNYKVILASEPLLEDAIKHSSGELKEYFSRHLEEERKHEEWLAKDLKVIGIDVEKADYDVIAAEMAGSQYYIIRHVNPVMFIGYMLFLEGFPASKMLVKDLELLYGEDAVRTLKYHSEHDIDHSKEIVEFIDGLTKEEKRLIFLNAQHTANNYSAAVRNIAQVGSMNRMMAS